MSQRKSLVNFCSISPDCSRQEFLAACKIYAREVVDKHGINVNVSDLSWEVSMRAKRRAAAVKHLNGDPKSICITWEFFQEKGWSNVAETIRHELIHVHLLNKNSDEIGHGEKFEMYADKLDTSTYCERFSEPKWWIVCEDCGGRIARYRRSKVVKSPENYECSSCGGRLYVKNNMGHDD
jgi:predicted SprT family Zn-dependent metalloprotease